VTIKNVPFYSSVHCHQPVIPYAHTRTSFAWPLYSNRCSSEGDIFNSVFALPAYIQCYIGVHAVVVVVTGQARPLPTAAGTHSGSCSHHWSTRHCTKVIHHHCPAASVTATGDSPYT